MMSDAVYVKKYEEPPFDRKEILRYMGCKVSDPRAELLIDECLDEITAGLTYRVCYREFKVSHTKDGLDLGFTVTGSRDLSKNLEGCRGIILFAATCGIAPDRLIARYGRLSPAKALCFQAIGAERIESLCDEFNRDISSEAMSKGLYTRPRFSPGYGDLSLSVQKEIFAVLDCHRKIGLSLNDSLLMSPSKSVTAIIGLGPSPRAAAGGDCASCSKQNCGFRKDKP